MADNPLAVRGIDSEEIATEWLEGGDSSREIAFAAPPPRSRPLVTIARYLALGLYHIVSVPPAIVEPLIAISIAYVAIENLFLSDLRSWRIALVFLFGLLHGMGFAGALGELGLPRSEFVTALVGFNVGVEAGQLTVIAAAFALVGWQWGNRSWYRRLIVVPASAMIAGVAVYWTIARLMAA